MTDAQSYTLERVCVLNPSVLLSEADELGFSTHKETLDFLPFLPQISSLIWI